jgi:DNA repair protein RecO (recombination protein O)
MQEKTRGIVLGYIKHRETSIIVNIYTEKFGLRSYIENGVRSSKSKNKIALFQPLSLLDMVVFENKVKNISRLSEIKSDHPYIEIPYHMAKSSIGLFLLEIFKKSLREENANPPLFTFLYNALLFLDSTQAPVVQFHLLFLILRIL